MILQEFEAREEKKIPNLFRFKRKSRRNYELWFPDMQNRERKQFLEIMSNESQTRKRQKQN